MIPSAVVSRTPRASTTPVRSRAGRPTGRRERGAVLVHVAVAMMGLLAFSALTIDLGSLWVARAQAQNAADAGALAGAVALAYVDPADPDAARAAAAAIVQEHQVWGQPVAPASLQTTTGTCPPGSPAVPGECLQVRVSRGTASGTPLPVFFSRLFGVNATDVTASASAKVLLGNASSCLRPLAILDSWRDTFDVTAPIDATWTITDRFERYADAGVIPPALADTYVPPTATDPGTGYTLAAELGVRVRLARGTVNSSVVAAGNQYFNLDVPRAGSPAGGGDYEQRYLDNMASCSGVPVPIGQTVGYFDAHWDDTIEPAGALVASDPGAHWDGTAIRGSAFSVSPRLLVVALIDPDHYARQTRPSAGLQYLVRNFVGFFLEDAGGADHALTGVLMPTSGTFAPSGDRVTENAAFLRTVALVR